MALPRTVALLPAASEIVCALGAQDALVGRSHECDYPTSLSALPICTASRLPEQGSSRAIDTEVKRILQDGLSLYRVDAEQLRRLAPDVVITQTQCEVCAVSLDDVENALAQWVGHRPTLVSLESNRLDEVWRTFIEVGEALGMIAAGEALAARAAERTEALGQHTQRLSPSLRLACIEWLDPLMSAGNWVPDLISAAGAIDAFDVTPGEHSPWLADDALRTAMPDVVVAMPCGFSMAQTEGEIETLLARLRIDAPEIIRNQRVAIVDGNQYFNRPGPRLVESVEILTEILDTNPTPKRHEDRAWRWVR
ncbi:MAG: ABC transporter substrate-binding protein [Pseudomonadota bacterium]